MRPSAFHLIFPLTLAQQSLFDHYPHVKGGKELAELMGKAQSVYQTKPLSALYRMFVLVIAGIGQGFSHQHRA